ncbi:MAG: helix-turn-helix domain-containing protein [Bacillaceae bacterium]
MITKNSSNYILQAKSNEFYWEGNGQLSIKTFTNGNAYYKTNNGFFAVDESRYLLVNEGPYALSIDEKNEVESFCIFFQKGFAEEVFCTIANSSDTLLSDPYKTISPVGFFEKTYKINHLFSSQLNFFKTNRLLHEYDSLWHEEQFYKLMQLIIFEHTHTLKDIESLHALHFSTREELFRRISIAHDYIRAFYNQQIKLQDIAQVACLSPNHLLRNYSKFYGKTPHQHISELRIIQAKKLLTNLKSSITDISFELGFNNPVSFSKMFKQHVGISPIQFRKKVIMDKN